VEEGLEAFVFAPVTFLVGSAGVGLEPRNETRRAVARLPRSIGSRVVDYQVLFCLQPPRSALAGTVQVRVIAPDAGSLMIRKVLPLFEFEVTV
jgi:hypothetical protein